MNTETTNTLRLQWLPGLDEHGREVLVSRWVTADTLALGASAWRAHAA